MSLKLFFIDSFHLFLFCLYPLTELYVYFVFLGIFCLEDLNFKSWIVIVLFFIYHIFLILKLTYYMYIFTITNYSTLDIFSNNSEETLDDELDSINPFFVQKALENTKINKMICEECNTYKPPRCHHCKRCNRCYLKRDHHSLFLDICIGFHNYKFYYQFIFVNTLSIIFIIIVFATSLGFHNNRSFRILGNYIASLAIYLLELIFNFNSLINHTRLISLNETTVENKAINAYIKGDNSYSYVFQEGPIKIFIESDNRREINPYNLGLEQNWIEVFGQHPASWLSTNLSTTGDGISFKTNEEEQEKI